jgi:diaminopimelate epimerase
MVEFSKYHGLGNDFAIVEAGAYGTTEAEVAWFCDRHRGVGADGIIFYSLGGPDGADATMIIYNRDGSRPQMCGNGIRCLARHLVEVVGLPGDGLRVATDAGMRTTHVLVSGQGPWEIAVEMGPGRWQKGQSDLEFEGERLPWDYVDMGNPHAVLFSSRDLAFVDRLGSWANRDKGIFPEGVNVEFVELLGPSHLGAVVYERGVGRTLACGTGACAVAVAAWRSGRVEPARPVRVELPGGPLTIEERDGAVWMIGEATAVFRGVTR